MVAWVSIRRVLLGWGIGRDGAWVRGLGAAVLDWGRELEQLWLGRGGLAGFEHIARI